MAGERSPLQVAKAVLARGRRPDTELEVYVSYKNTLEIRTFGGEVESIVRAKPQGVGVRALSAGRMGYAFTADLSPAGLGRVLVEAVNVLEAADIDPCAALPDPPREAYPILTGLWSPDLGATGTETKIRMALKAEAAALAVPGVETVEASVYFEEDEKVAVASSKGVEAETERSFCLLYVWAHAGEGSDRQSGVGFTAGRSPAALDPESAGREAAEKARVLVGGRPCPTGKYPVVFSRETAAALIARIAPALSAEVVQKGRSVFAGKVGELVASPCFSLRDDGLAREGSAAGPFDDEGVPRRVTTLFDQGVLRSYLYDTRAAHRAGPGFSSTGNAARTGYRAAPVIAPTNLVVEPGGGEVASLLEHVDHGVYVESVIGLHSGINPVSGEISIGAAGRMISRGCLGGPVREITLATDFCGLLGSVCGLAGDSRWIPLYGSVCTPTIAVEGVAVSGR